jgi:hypothetical protein
MLSELPPIVVLVSADGILKRSAEHRPLRKAPSFPLFLFFLGNTNVTPLR